MAVQPFSPRWWSAQYQGRRGLREAPAPPADEIGEDLQRTYWQMVRDLMPFMKDEVPERRQDMPA